MAESAGSGLSVGTADDGGGDGVDGGDGADGGDGGDGADGGDDDGHKFDIPSGDDGATGGDGSDACKKVDVLFVIDDSVSMAEEQQSLIASFPGFVDGMRAELEGVDSYHVGVTTTAAYPYNGSCSGLGSLITTTGGPSSSNSPCGPFSEGAYMTEADLDSFACTAQVGAQMDGPSQSEQMVQSAINAIADGINGAGGCNEGFIRRDALLVLVIITDEDDVTDQVDILQGLSATPGDPPQWFESVVAIKDGLQQDFVVVPIVGQADAATSCPPDPVGGPGAVHAQRIIQFANHFTHNFVGDVCAADYASTFTSAVSIIDSACDEFVPPG